MNITPRIVVGPCSAAVAVGSGFSSRASAYVACQGSRARLSDMGVHRLSATI
jgi:hypothetical protein